jgi:hypothetical protein
VPRTPFALLLLAAPAFARALCTSDDLPEPPAVLERFTSADCETCWRDPATPAAPASALALDWVVPGRKGADAPLSEVALDEAAERLRFLKRSAPERTVAVTSAREGAPVRLRIAQGEAFNDYIGASIELQGAARGPLQTWLLLVERLPAGIEGSPVPRNLVRNVFRPPGWELPRRGMQRLEENRAMQIHEGARPDRLRLVALAQDVRGRMRVIRQTECRE